MPIAYAPDAHVPRIDLLAEESGGTVPPRVRDALAGDSHVGVCAGCRTISHVVGHRAATV